MSKNSIDINLDENVSASAIHHLPDLQLTIGNYFPIINEPTDFIFNPFCDCENNCELKLKEREQVIDISTDLWLKEEYRKGQLMNFWIQT